MAFLFGEEYFVAFVGLSFRGKFNLGIGMGLDLGLSLNLVWVAVLKGADL
jgi:hypothetical protein